MPSTVGGIKRLKFSAKSPEASSGEVQRSGPKEFDIEKLNEDVEDAEDVEDSEDVEDAEGTEEHQ
jgi:hypothetical protein